MQFNMMSETLEKYLIC